MLFLKWLSIQNFFATKVARKKKKGVPVLKNFVRNLQCADSDMENTE